MPGDETNCYPSFFVDPALFAGLEGQFSSAKKGCQEQEGSVVRGEALPAGEFKVVEAKRRT